MYTLKLSKQTRLFVIGLILVILTTVTRIIDSKLPPVSQLIPPSPTSIATPSANYVLVKRVVDGDTIEIESGPASAKASPFAKASEDKSTGKQIVRYIGMDTPELHDPKKSVQCFADESYEKNKELIEGKIVRLEKDVSNTDKYGRLLRYVYLENNNASPSSIMINELLVREGYASVATFPPDVKFAELFRLAQREAMDNNRGLWNKCK